MWNACTIGREEENNSEGGQDKNITLWDSPTDDEAEVASLYGMLLLPLEEFSDVKNPGD